MKIWWHHLSSKFFFPKCSMQLYFFNMYILTAQNVVQTEWVLVIIDLLCFVLSVYTPTSVAWQRLPILGFSIWQYLLHQVMFPKVHCPIWLWFHVNPFFFCSDVSDIPEETYPLLKDCEILIMVHCLSSCYFSAYEQGISNLLDKHWCAGCIEARSIFCNTFRTAQGTLSSSFTCVIPHLHLWWKFNPGLDFLKALEEVRKIQPKRTLFTGKFTFITRLLLKILS